MVYTMNDTFMMLIVQFGKEDNESGRQALGMLTKKVLTIKMSLQTFVIAVILIGNLQIGFTQVTLVMFGLTVDIECREIVKG